jgi:hypothetical protein
MLVEFTMHIHIVASNKDGIVSGTYTQSQPWVVGLAT